MTHVRRYARRAIRRSAALGDALRPPRAGVVVLAYHRVGGASDSSVDLPVDLFRLHMDHLAEHHRVIGLDEATEGLHSDTLPERAVVLTFDDGTSDFVDTALPIMAERELPSTVYLATGYIGTARTFPWGAPALSWDQVRDASSTGLVCVGGHTHGHRVMDKVTVAEATADLDLSDDVIGAQTGTAPRHFAYPKGVVARDDVEAEIARRYDTAATGRVGVNTAETNRHRLFRTPVQRTDTLEWFARKAGGGLALEGTVRELVNGVRYRKAAS